MLSPSATQKWINAVFGVSLLLLLACNRQSRTPEESGTPVPVEQEQHHHLVMQNDSIRVYRAELASGANMKLHRHDQDYVAVYLTDAQLKEFVPGKAVQLVRHQSGQVRFSQAPLTHSVSNTSNEAFRVVLVELAKPPGGKPSSQAPPEGEHSLDLGHGHIEDVLLNNSRVLATELQIAPGMETDENAGAHPRLLVWMDDGEVVSGAGGEPLRGKKGDVSWLNPNAGNLRNTGDHPAHLITLEFK
jgi:quercetin dioxygenase-like cupin family protein